MRVLPAQTTELMNWLRQAIDVHIIKKHVPEFQAWRCHGKGTRARTNPKNETIGKRG